MTEYYEATKQVSDTVSNLDTRALEILLTRGQQMVELAQGLVRVDTGTLQSDIKMIVSQSQGDVVSIRITAGGTRINPKTGKVCDYAQAVEAKFPFLRPAFDFIDPLIKADLGAIVNEHG